MKFTTLSVTAPAYKRQTDDTFMTEVLPGITGEEPVEYPTTTFTSTSDALAAANPFDIYRSPPAVPPTFPIEQNDLTDIQGQGVASIEDDDDIVDAAISNLSGTAPPIPLTAGTPISNSDADAISTLDFADGDDDDTNIEDLNVYIPPIPLSTGTATIEDGILSVDDVIVGFKMAEEMIDAAVRAAQQLPATPLSTGTPTIFVDPYLGNTTSGVFGNSTTSASEDGAASTAVDGSNLTASLQSLTDALAAYQDLMDASATGTGTATTATTATTDGTSMERKIKMFGDDMLSGIQQIAKRAEMAEEENRKMGKKMKKVLRQCGM